MQEGKRLLIYSHDSFGLGHLRRCRAIAHDLVDKFRGLSVLILSGSPIIGSFDFRARVDFIRVPGVIKLRNGEYTSLKLHIDTERTLAMRASIIQHTAELFEPHLFLVDKEPLGLRGEVESTLRMLRARGTRCVLGLRDVMDEPGNLLAEWERKEVFPALDNLYDDIWVYGLPEIFDPIKEIPGMGKFAHKLSFTGYIRRNMPEYGKLTTDYSLPDEPYIFVTAGGGGDGDVLIDWVLRAYESDAPPNHPALVLFGPFMQLETRVAFQERVNRLQNVHSTTFEAHVEELYERALGVVAMGGYNTFCEILSFGKPGLIVPRTVPRQEQLLRAQRASELGLVRYLEDDDIRDAKTMASAIDRLAVSHKPDQTYLDRMFSGLDTISELSAPWLDEHFAPPRRANAGV
ncbi:MAG: glycosyltransferase [Geminicoccaceae bacterium]